MPARDGVRWRPPPGPPARVGLVPPAPSSRKWLPLPAPHAREWLQPSAPQAPEPDAHLRGRTLGRGHRLPADRQQQPAASRRKPGPAELGLTRAGRPPTRTGCQIRATHLVRLTTARRDHPDGRARRQSAPVRNGETRCQLRVQTRFGLPLHQRQHANSGSVQLRDARRHHAPATLHACQHRARFPVRSVVQAPTNVHPCATRTPLPSLAVPWRRCGAWPAAQRHPGSWRDRSGPVRTQPDPSSAVPIPPTWGCSSSHGHDARRGSSSWWMTLVV